MAFQYGTLSTRFGRYAPITRIGVDPDGASRVTSTIRNGSSTRRLSGPRSRNGIREATSVPFRPGSGSVVVACPRPRSARAPRNVRVVRHHRIDHTVESSPTALPDVPGEKPHASPEKKVT